MIYSQNRIEKLVDSYENLLDIVRAYVEEKYPNQRTGDLRIDRYYIIEEYVNTACHCHPEYDWVSRGDVKDLSEWIKSKGDRYTPTHYTKQS